MGSAVAPPRELAEAIADAAPEEPQHAKVTLIPVDVRTWDAHMPHRRAARCAKDAADARSKQRHIIVRCTRNPGLRGSSAVIEVLWR